MNIGQIAYEEYLKQYKKLTNIVELPWCELSVSEQSAWRAAAIKIHLQTLIEMENPNINQEIFKDES